MKRLRIIELPALDAALTRADRWWEGLSQRERVLVTVLGALLALVVLVYGVVKPIQAARADAIADIRKYETLNARLRTAGRIDPTAASRRRSGTPAEIITASATSFGIAAAAVPLPGGGMRATVADASYDSLLAWLADLGATSTLSVTRADFTRLPTAGRVSATVDFAP